MEQFAIKFLLALLLLGSDCCANHCKDAKFSPGYCAHHRMRKIPEGCISIQKHVNFYEALQFCQYRLKGSFSQNAINRILPHFKCLNLDDEIFYVNGMLFMGNWLEIGDTTRTPLKLNVQLNSTDLCQNESVLSWTPHPYPFGTFSCINRWKKMDIMCLTELRFDPVNGQWSEWGDYDSCSVSCGEGFQFKHRNCNEPRPAYGGLECIGSSYESSTCNPGPCTADGNWSLWSPFSPCSITCNTGANGTQIRTRRCNNPAPLNNGLPCTGPSNETQSCKSFVGCPIDGNWSSWSSFSTCSVTCDTRTNGTQIRSRICNNPAPLNNGQPCSGPSNETQSCASIVACPIDGNWSSWSPFSPCSVTCDTGTNGTQIRTRLCNNPEPLNNGQPCTGSSNETQSCRNFVGCPIVVSIFVLNSQNNVQIPGAIVSVNGTNYTTPVNLGTIIAGTVLQVTVIASGFISESRNVIISNLAGNFRQQVTFNMAPVLAFNAMTAIMTWGPVANDLDFHSVEMNKTSFATCEAYYRSTSCPGSAYFRDNIGTGDQGSEAINLSDKFNFIYGLFVINYRNTLPLSQTGAYVNVYGLKNQLITINVPSVDSNSKYWTVACLDGATGSLDLINIIADTTPTDIINQCRAYFNI